MDKITNIKINRLGTLSFDGKFKGMRKTQEFLVYPIQKDSDTSNIVIQSDTRIGRIFLDSGEVVLSPSRAGGSFFVHMVFAKKADTLSKEELAGLIFRLVQTAGERVGNNSMSVFTDNSDADKVKI